MDLLSVSEALDEAWSWFDCTGESTFAGSPTEVLLPSTAVPKRLLFPSTRELGPLGVSSSSLFPGWLGGGSFVKAELTNWVVVNDNLVGIQSMQPRYIFVASSAAILKQP
ncbi:hypothetical protein IPA_08015 [Ignicoccus pacificus DSM 13166]|uniref:Uncharacterized protein n=1 Tax=Ignicoccus pacificus DSM 13166 TaxID=940294 RepID=A0A977KD85_9CREN|nr:hypothetical protein IPA_08015 [Ignicoccus pacificus DSM 13166]